MDKLSEFQLRLVRAQDKAYKQGVADLASSITRVFTNMKNEGYEAIDLDAVITLINASNNTAQAFEMDEEMIEYVRKGMKMQ